jgi:hypothetical protein
MTRGPAARDPFHRVSFGHQGVLPALTPLMPPFFVSNAAPCVNCLIPVP